MDPNQYSYVEQDPAPGGSGNELPTYDDLAAQNGPNSRFGRWRGWIEKRAAERYADITPEEKLRRRERGWGNDDMAPRNSLASPDVPIIVNEPATPGPTNLHVQTSNLDPFYAPSEPPPSPPLPPLPSVSTKLRPTHLRLHHFGSRFLPHATSQIRCLLPLLSDRLLLIGHDDGLSVMDMYAQEWSETGHINVKGPEEAQARLIWQGESVFQMTLLEIGNATDGTPQGVVLALVGPESDTPKDNESMRSLRMYNLASLTSLAKWAAAQKGARPLDLRRPSNWHAQQTPVKKHRHQGSIARSLKSLIDSPGGSTTSSPETQTSSYQALLSPSPSIRPSSNGSTTGSRPGTPSRNDSDDSQWDLVDELPLRWATDFVPLATPNSRLSSTSVISYALWSGENPAKGQHGRLLAVATKGFILLYEAPKGERAFRFVKDFYTPTQPRTVSFFQQAPNDVSRSSSDAGARFSSHRRTDSTATLRDHKANITSATMNSYGPQMCLFVLFEKKAGWIRLADSAVGEIEFYDSGHSPNATTLHARESSSPSTLRKSRSSVEPGPIGKWITPAICELPVPPSARHGPMHKNVCILTRGSTSHILPFPLPTASACPPLRVVHWRYPCSSVTARVFGPFEPDMDGRVDPPYLQLINLGEHGVEVQEIGIDFVNRSKGKGKAVMTDVRAEEDIGGASGFLCVGGHWDSTRYNAWTGGISRTYSNASTMSGMSMSSMSSGELLQTMKKEEGVYGWCCKGAQDWRVFWLGGTHLTDDDDDDES